MGYARAIAQPTRAHSITIFGCTGNAGKAVAYHMIRNAAQQISTSKIALAGRNKERIGNILSSIQTELSAEGINSSFIINNVDIIIADVTDYTSMLELCKLTNVLISATGPYSRYGEPVVRACIEAKTHYVDITGEVPWVERMIGQYDQLAIDAGVTLLPFSGYDCVPAEVGMWLVGSALQEENDHDDCDGNGMGVVTLGKLELNFGGKGGGFPRGTIETILNSIEGKYQPTRQDSDPRFYPLEYRKTAKDALSISHFLLPKYQLGQFTGPNLMSGVNVPVLCRAASTFGHSSVRGGGGAEGGGSTRSELTISDKSVFVSNPSLLNGYGLIGSTLYISVLVMSGVAAMIPPFRSWLRRRLQTYSFNGDPTGKVYLHAKGSSAMIVGNDTPSSYATAKCVFPGDAGIYATGLFAASVATSLLEVTTPTSSSSSNNAMLPLAGFHSPVAALQVCRPGLLVERLTAMGAQIAVELVPRLGDNARVIDITKLPRSKL